MPKLPVLWLAMAALFAACGNNYDYISEPLKTQTNAQSCTIERIEDVGNSRLSRKMLKISLQNPVKNPYELDDRYYASVLAMQAYKLLKPADVENFTKLSIVLQDSTKATPFNYALKELKNARYFIAKADTFVQAFVYSDTIKFESMLNLTYITTFDAIGSMIQTQMLQDSLGIAKQFKFLGYDTKQTENGNYVYAVRYAAIRRGKVHDIYDINIGVKDTLVSGYTWMLP